MRIDVKKFLFVGAASELEKFFQNAQAQGFVHFIEAGPNKFKEVPQEIGLIQRAIKVTLGLPVIEQVEPDLFLGAEKIVQEILDLQNTIDKLLDEEKVLRLEISRIEVFGNYDQNTIDILKNKSHAVLQFFVAPTDVIKDLPEEMFFAGSEHGLDYFFAVNKERKSYEKMTEMVIEKPLHQVQEQLNEVIHKKNDLYKKLKDYQKYSNYLHRYMYFRLNHYNRIAAENDAEKTLDGHLFAIAGWVPIDRTADLDRLTTDTGVTYEEIEIEPHDVIPTYLENQGFSLLGEDLVHIYDTPSSQDRDPSLWVLFAFTFFFAFIMNDAGYGLILLLALLFIKFKYPNIKEKGKRFLKLGIILSTGVIIWGILTNSFFGVNIDIDSPLRQFSVMNYLVEKRAAYHLENKDESYQEYVKKYPELKDAKTPKEFLFTIKKENGEVDYEIFEKLSRVVLLEAALLTGVVHLILSFGRNLYRNLSGIGWILFLVGGFIYFPIFLDAHTFMDYIFHINREWAAQVGVQLMIAGIVIATGFALYQHRWLGLLEPAHAIQVFADVMSYLRLYALGLAGAIVAVTINEMAQQLPIILAIFLLIFAHIVNLLLSIMGATIHGLRLNFLEWYRHSFEGGGKMFNPLRLFKID